METPPEQIFLDHLPQIEKVIASVCRRHHLQREDAQDFASMVKVKLIEDDYGVLRKFSGKSSIGTYLMVVVQRLMLDHRNHLWGKWRPSAEALRLGEVAVRLDELTGRDGRSFDEAYEILRTNEHYEISRQELVKIFERLPPRTPRRLEGEEALLDLPAPGESADRRVLGKEREEIRQRIEAALPVAMAQLSGEDQLVVQLRERFSIAEIARLHNLDQKQLYRRVTNILKTLRKELEEQGIRREDVAAVLDWEDL
ncbi:MAG TPA: sigma-70 family RNA polymerase sigma factor [Thermoanaerobaculia bacterium]|nr:sigma-70 family RNA polymerase sigma factor [Thermoanaerobaculia bacterium]